MKMTKLQKIGLLMSVLSAILWVIGLVFGWNYSNPHQLDGVFYIGDSLQYHIFHFIMIAVFVIGIGIILAEIARKSLKMACIISVISVLLGRFSITFMFWRVFGCCSSEIYVHISKMFGLMLMVLWLVSFFFVIKYLTNSNKWSIIALLMVVSFVGIFIIWLNTLCDGNFLRCLEKSFNRLFLIFLVISVIFCSVSRIKSYKESKKSS